MMRAGLLALVSLACTLASAQVSHHVVVVVEENTNASKVIGSSAMPYLNSLAKRYGLATAYYANTHPSIGNYFAMTTGKIITNNNGYSGTVTANNIARQLLSAGKTWKAYAESLPYTGYVGGDRYPYVKHHNPFAYFQDVRNSSSEKLNIVPFSKFASDLSNRNLPNFSFVIPNQHHNMHDCPTSSGCTFTQKAAAADVWLKKYIAPVFSSPQFQKDGLLVILWDEASSSDSSYGGGRVAVVFAGPIVKAGSRTGTHYNHYSLLKTAERVLGLPYISSSTSSMTTLLK